MTTQIVLLRGINIGAKRRVGMPALRELLADGGFGDVRTYVQSGNVVLASRKAPTRVGVECERLISAAFGFQVDVVVRTRDELAEVVARNPSCPNLHTKASGSSPSIGRCMPGIPMAWRVPSFRTSWPARVSE